MKPPGAAIDAARLLCPLCGHPNECAIAAGSSTPCWCTDAVFPPDLRARAARAGCAARCICARCARAATPTQAFEGAPPDAR